MTDAQTKLKLQHAHATSDLNYGHLGTASYLEYSKDWAFLRGQNEGITDDTTHTNQRANCPAFPFVHIGYDKPYVQHFRLPDAADTKINSDTLFDCRLSRLLPELLLETGHYRQGHGVISEEQDSGIESLLQPSQLAFGGAAAVLNNGKSNQTIPIAAIVTGRHFEQVKILLIGKETVQLNNVNGHNCTYQIPKIDYDEEGYWAGNGDAVQQVCFAAARDFESTQSAWLAVRCRSGTTIFHPLFHKTRSKAEEGISRLVPNPILNIPISRTGGYPHADVVFHPQDHRLIAIVDVHGNWSVWKIEGSNPILGRILFAAQLQSAGRLFPDRSHRFTQHDWHCIRWICRTPNEADRLLVSNSSNCATFDLTGANLGLIDLRSGSTKEWLMILDVVKSNTNPTHCFILTSTKLLLMSADEHDWPDPHNQQHMTIILSWSHYRDRSDSSLRLILVEAAQATTVLITSTHNTMVTAFRVGLSMEHLSFPLSLADPIHLSSLVADTEGVQPQSRILTFRGLQVLSKAGVNPPEDHPILFKAFVGQYNSPIREILYRCTDDSVSTFGKSQSTAISFPVMRIFKWRSAKYANIEDLDDFIDADELTPWGFKKTSAQPWVEAAAESPLLRDPKSASVDWQDVYSMVTGRNNDLNEDKTPIALVAALEDVHVGIKEGAGRPTMLQTLREMIRRPTLMSDFGHESQHLERFIKDLSGLHALQVRIAELPCLDTNTGSSNVDDFLHRLSEIWITTLPLSTDNRIRLSKYRLVRSVAAELALSSVIIGLRVNDAHQIAGAEPQMHQESIEQDVDDLPSLPPSLATIAASIPAEDPACARLRKYGTLAKPIAPLSTSRTLTDILAHLPADVTVDPTAYDWRATEARLAASHAEADLAAQLNPRAEARWRRKAEKQAAAQKRRLEAQQQLSEAAERDLAPPPVVLSSRFAGPPREVQTSQERPPEDEGELVIPAVMTQPVYGASGGGSATGGRTLGGRKKARQQGF